MSVVHEIDDTDGALVALIVAGNTPTAAATTLGLAASTIYRRMRGPAFRLALAEARAGLWNPQCEALHEAANGSIATMIEIRDSEEHPAAVRLKASVAIIELAVRLHSIINVETRLVVLEAALVEDSEPVAA